MMQHPNEFDLRRIERGLTRRVRYRYVAPRVLETARGYRVESPCCSRNVNAAGGVIDIALLEYDTGQRLWCLYRKDHAAKDWALEEVFARLHEALALLAEDPRRKFWQ